MNCATFHCFIIKVNSGVLTHILSLTPTFQTLPGQLIKVEMMVEANCSMVS